MKKYIGKSLSFCIQEICEGKVELRQVDKIICGICCPTIQEFEKLLEDYMKTYWRDYPKLAKVVAMCLWKSGKLIQPRVNGEEPPNIADGTIWRVVK